ncbi:MAG: hypothetical protein PHC64_05975 [Candidatus Gastranaerophilales bacterium]|nr:hypothetical protein [Candidatus Gastranaerophilales bacterium]
MGGIPSAQPLDGNVKLKQPATQTTNTPGYSAQNSILAPQRRVPGYYNSSNLSDCLKQIDQIGNIGGYLIGSVAANGLINGGNTSQIYALGDAYIRALLGACPNYRFDLSAPYSQASQSYQAVQPPQVQTAQGQAFQPAQGQTPAVSPNNNKAQTSNTQQASSTSQTQDSSKTTDAPFKVTIKCGKITLAKEKYDEVYHEKDEVRLNGETKSTYDTIEGKLGLRVDEYNKEFDELKAMKEDDPKRAEKEAQVGNLYTRLKKLLEQHGATGYGENTDVNNSMSLTVPVDTKAFSDEDIKQASGDDKDIMDRINYILKNFDIKGKDSDKEINVNRSIACRITELRNKLTAKTAEDKSKSTETADDTKDKSNSNETKKAETKTKSSKK